MPYNEWDQFERYEPQRRSARPAPARSTNSLRPVSTREPLISGFDEGDREAEFQSWYADRAGALGLDSDPDAPEHYYDYRAAHAAGAEPDETGHWPSKYKKEGHPRMVVDGKNTKTGEPASEWDQFAKAEDEGDTPPPEIDFEAEALKAIPLQPGPDGEEDIRITRQREQLASRWRDMAEAEARGEVTGPAEITAQPWFKRRNFGIGEIGQFDAGPSALDVIRALPDIGGGVGGILGAGGGTLLEPGGGTLVGGLKGAALGGAGGEAIKQLALRAIGARPGSRDLPETPLDAAKSIALEGGKQAAFEAGGRALGWGARKVGGGAVERALAPSADTLEHFPNVVEDTIRHRVPVGRGYTGKAAKTTGSEIAARKLDKASRKVEALLDDAGNKGTAYLMASKGGSKADRAIMYVQNVAGESKAVQKLLARPTADGVNFVKSKTTQPIIDLINDVHLSDAQFPGKFNQLEKLVDNFLKQRNGPLTPRDLQDIQQRAYKIAKQIYDARASGASLGPRAVTRAAFNEALAKGIKEGVMDKIPGVAAGQAEKQALMGVEQAVKAAELRPSAHTLAADALPAALGALVGMAQGGGGLDSADNALVGAALSWALTRGVIHPRQLSRAGLTLTAPQTTAILKQFPRLGDVLYRTHAARQRDFAEDIGIVEDTFPQARAQSTLR